MIFPRKEDEIFALGGKIQLGLSAHGSVFPDPPYGPAGIGPLIYGYIQSRSSVLNTSTEYKEAMAAKKAAFDELIRAMKFDLQYAEQVTNGDNEKLGLIGWGPKKPGEPVGLPGMPFDLVTVLQNEGGVVLQWRAPGRDMGGAVRSFIIERRAMEDSTFGPWQQIGVSFEPETSLMNQPRGVQLEYRIKSSNTTGESSPGNTVAVVL